MSVWTDEMKSAAMQDAQRVCDLTAAPQEITRLRLATDEGTCRVRFDRAWQIATDALNAGAHTKST